MTPKETASKFQEIFGLDFHDFVDREAWRTQKVIKLDFFKFDEWFSDRFDNTSVVQSLKDNIEHQYGKTAAEFIESIL